MKEGAAGLPAGSTPVRVLLPCSGLEHARRGFETFARECFEALRDEPGLELHLAKGSGAGAPSEHRVPSLRRDWRLTQQSVALTGRRAFDLEAFSFGVALLPLLRRLRPDVVYLSEWQTARVLAAWRARLRTPFKLLLCNGSFAERGFERFDRVQELTPAARDWVLARGADPDRHVVLPLGFRLPEAAPVLPVGERQALRRRLGLPPEGTLILTVAALNVTHKRLDYLIEEAAAYHPPPFLLMVGEPEAETAELRRLAAERLPERHAFRTVAPSEIPALLVAADVFVLPSLVEMQGRALVEAAAHGLPCVAHDNPVMRLAAGPAGFYGDLGRSGSLQALLAEALSLSPQERRRRATASHAWASRQFGWDQLRPRYVELLRETACAKSTVSSSTAAVARR